MSRQPIVVVIPKRSPAPAKPHPTARPTFTPKGKQNPLAFAHLWLGSRFTEQPQSFVLDGLPANLDTVMRAANMVAHTRGNDMLTVNPRWVP